MSNDAAPRWSAARYSAFDWTTVLLVSCSRPFISCMAPSHLALAVV